MDTARPRQIEELYHRALGLSAAARNSLLAKAHPDVRREVESLLAQESEGGPLDRPALEIAAELLQPATDASGGAAAEPSRIGQYRIVSRVGAGGMGVVYQAEQEYPRRMVALKVIRPGWSNPELYHRFERESQALGRLQHPGIAQIYEAGTADAGFGPQPFFAMEYIRGESLGRYAEANRLSTRARLELMVKICEAVHHAHRRGIIHRDLKPGNILVDDTGQPKILDFGVARITDSDAQATRQTDIGQIVGTLAYMSPEQVLADPLELDTRSDVYALGVILYELLAGRLPYLLSRHLHEAVYTIRETDPQPLSSISQAYRGDIETIVSKALEKDKARRYTSAAELAADIRHYLGDEPITARPPSTLYHLGKFARRHRTLVAAVGVVFLVLVAGTIVSTWQAIRADRAGRLALAERDRAAAARQAAGKDRDRALSAEQLATDQRNRALAAQSQAVQERNYAVAERRRADDEAATAKAVSDFLQKDLLAQASANNQARAETKPDPEMKVRTALDRAAARIEGKFAKQPLVEAAIRQTIGKTYRDLGLLPQAQPQLERALELRTRFQGSDNPETLEAMSNLGDIYIDQSKVRQAESLYLKVLDGRRKLLGPDDPATLSTISSLTTAYDKEGRYAEAAPLQAKALELLRRSRGEDNYDTIVAMVDMALLDVRLGKYGPAEKLDLESVERLQHTLGGEHPDTLNVMNNLAQVYYRQEKYAEAERLQTQILEVRRRVLGEEHNDTLTGMSNLAVIYDAEGKYSQAEALQTKVLETRRRVLGEEHRDTLTSMGNLAAVYSLEEKYPEAEALQRKTLEIRRRVLRPDHPDILTSMNNLASVYRASGKYAEAEPLYSKVLEIRRRDAGVEHPLTTDVMLCLADVLVHQGKYAEAEAAAREPFGILQKISPGSWKLFYAQSLLGASLSGQKKYQNAEPLLIDSYPGLLSLRGSNSKYGLGEAGPWIVELYRNWGLPEKAAEWQQKVNGDKMARAKK